MREFQLMTSAPNDNSLSSDQNANKLFGVGGDWIPKSCAFIISKSNFYYIVYDMIYNIYFKKLNIFLLY